MLAAAATWPTLLASDPISKTTHLSVLQQQVAGEARVMAIR